MRFETIGQRSGDALVEKIQGRELALVKVLPLTMPSLAEIALDAPSHIECTPFVDRESWFRDFNDKLYLRYQPNAAWTHFQVGKDEVLKHWPRVEDEG